MRNNKWDFEILLRLSLRNFEIKKIPSSERVVITTLATVGALWCAQYP